MKGESPFGRIPLDKDKTRSQSSRIRKRLTSRLPCKVSPCCGQMQKREFTARRNGSYTQAQFALMRSRSLKLASTFALSPQRGLLFASLNMEFSKIYSFTLKFYIMKTLRFSSKLAQKFASAYLKSNYHCLLDVYRTVSRDKHIAQANCLLKMVAEEGFDFRIISANTFQFTAAWQTIEGLRVETRNNSYLIKELPF